MWISIQPHMRKHQPYPLILAEHLLRCMCGCPAPADCMGGAGLARLCSFGTARVAAGPPAPPSPSCAAVSKSRPHPPHGPTVWAAWLGWVWGRKGHAALALCGKGRGNRTASSLAKLAVEQWGTRPARCGSVGCGGTVSWHPMRPCAVPAKLAPHAAPQAAPCAGRGWGGEGGHEQLPASSGAGGRA